MRVHMKFKWVNTTSFPRAAVAHLGEPMISHVATWKELHLNQWFAKNRHKPQWKRSPVQVRG
jgi:hypothetical protein